MTKDEAIAKVRKLKNQAKGGGTPAETAAATKIAADIMKKYQISEADLRSDARVLAFEELLAELETYSRANELPPSVAEAVIIMKKNMTTKEKINTLEKTVSLIRLASFFLGKKQVGSIKDIVEKTLRKHEVVI